jgi:ABC-type transporter MlaC component
MEDAYLNKLEDYAGQKIEFVNETSNGPSDAQVTTRVIQPNGGQPINLNYRLKLQGGDSKVYDVTVDNISITANLPQPVQPSDQ